MRCPSCGTENPDDAVQCGSCNKKVGRRQRRRASANESNTPFVDSPDTRNPTALKAFRLGVFGLIPFLGLICGPLALLLGFVAWRQNRILPDPPRGGPAVAAMILGSLSTFTNWVGLALMWIGLTSV